MSSSHYVPRLILRKFSDRLSVYNVKKGELKENIPPEHAYAIENFYDAETEKKLNLRIESQFGGLLSNLILKRDKEISLSITTDSESIIYYTTNGTSPKNNGILYTDEILLTEGVTTVRAYATNEHGVMSEEIEATYIIAISLPDKPEATVPSGTYKEAQLITIYVPVGWTAYYTWDGTIPTLESNVYTEPFEMIEGNNVLAIIFINDQENHKVSDIAYYNYIYYPEESEGTSGDSDAGSEEDDITAGSDESDDTNN